jgi:predicted CoA-binding protein
MKSLVILGASDKPDRASNMLLNRAQARGGFDVIPVHPALDAIAGIPVRSALSEVPDHPDVLSVYLSADRSSALEAALVKLKPGKVIFNPGAENPGLEARLNAAGIATENACSLVLFGRGLL